ncbi:MAG: hypothetical protein U0872_06155 [Planctomycetaceae bacterium]
MSETSPKKTHSADFDEWREKLLASLRDCDTQRAPRFFVLRMIVFFLVALFTMTVASILGRLMGEGLRNAPAPIFIGAWLLFLLFTVGVLSRLRIYFLRQARQAGARSAEDELSRIGARRPILYLRSFALDRAIGRPSWLERYLGFNPLPNAEQLLTVELKKLGPVIAIGRPGEKLPALGAARFYVSHERWQEKVVDVLECAQLVVWATGVTEGLRWEISHLAANIHPRRLILWAHPHLLRGSAAQREAEWKKFRETLGAVFPKPLPETLGDARFFVFDGDWNPRAVMPPIANVFTDNQKSALRTALRLQQNGFDDPVANRPRLIDPACSSHDFGALLGARGRTIRWPLIGLLVVALLVASLATHFVTQLRYPSDFAPGIVRTFFTSLTTALVLAAAGVVAFRWVKRSSLAVLAAAAIATVSFLILRGLPAVRDDASPGIPVAVRLILLFLPQLFFYGWLTWTVARVSTLAGGLGFGYLLSEISAAYLRRVSDHFRMFGVNFSVGGIMEGLHETFVRFLNDFPFWGGMALMETAVFVGIYIIGLKILAVSSQPAPMVPAKAVAPAS